MKPKGLNTNINPGQDARAEPKLEGHRHQIEHSVHGRSAATQALTETHSHASMSMHMSQHVHVHVHAHAGSCTCPATLARAQLHTCSEGRCPQRAFMMTRCSVVWPGSLTPAPPSPGTFYRPLPHWAEAEAPEAAAGLCFPSSRGPAALRCCSCRCGSPTAAACASYACR